MQDFLNIFLDSSHWQWWGVAVLLFGAEVLAPSFFLLWPGLAAVVTGFIVYLFPEMGWGLQLLIFIVLALTSTVVGRRYFSQTQKETDQPGLNKREVQLIGQKLTLETEMKDGKGRINLGDSTWSAKSHDGEVIKKGQRVEIIDADGATLIIKQID